MKFKSKKLRKAPKPLLVLCGVVRSYIAVFIWLIRVKPSCSTFIDEDTIIMGYGRLDLEFYYPLPNWVVRHLYGTLSWDKYFKLKGIR